MWFAVANILASGSVGAVVLAIVRQVIKRKRPVIIAAEIHESEARTRKISAEARSIELKANISAGDTVLRMIQRLEFAQIANAKLHEDNERLLNENERYETQMRRAKALLKLHNIRFDEDLGG